MQKELQIEELKKSYLAFKLKFEALNENDKKYLFRYFLNNTKSKEFVECLKDWTAYHIKYKNLLKAEYFNLNTNAKVTAMLFNLDNPKIYGHFRYSDECAIILKVEVLKKRLAEYDLKKFISTFKYCDLDSNNNLKKFMLKICPERHKGVIEVMLNDENKLNSFILTPEQKEKLKIREIDLNC